MTLKELIEIVPSLKKLFVTDLPILQSYKLSKLADRVNQELEFYNSSKNELLRKYGTSSNGNEYQIPKENMQIFINKMTDLEGIIISPELPKVSITVNSDINLSAIDVMEICKIVKLEVSDDEDSSDKQAT